MGPLSVAFILRLLRIVIGGVYPGPAALGKRIGGHLAGRSGFLVIAGGYAGCRGVDKEGLVNRL